MPIIYNYFPRANGAKRRSGRKRGLLIPHGYLHPGKSEHSEGSAKSSNNRGRVTMFHGWTSQY